MLHNVGANERQSRKRFGFSDTVKNYEGIRSLSIIKIIVLIVKKLACVPIMRPIDCSLYGADTGNDGYHLETGINQRLHRSIYIPIHPQAQCSEDIVDICYRVFTMETYNMRCMQAHCRAQGDGA